ncbi:formyltransferase family protein [Salinimicrobium sp. HB62]|uniref:formyltransferase family protein n=1 Tax=Salinimicrobium sp. HB62 TaxID=3077781 RepID=UPI002D787847|nr:formyltransferase family protein [Salinimicrobium sp. HB62]
MKVVLLTSDSLRHRYIAASIANELELASIITENKSPKIQDTSAYGKKDAEFLAAHFKARAESEQKFFGEFREFSREIPLINVPHGQINSDEVFQIITDTDSDLIVLFGTSIIKDPLLRHFKDRIINLHLGLSPYYKGSATNLYPYLFDEPECIGATIHLATENVDEGAVLYQLRPEISETDDMHEIGNKVIDKAGRVLPTVLRKYFEEQIKPQLQSGEGKICRNKDLTPETLQKIYGNFEQEMIGRYLEKKEKRDKKKPIVQ